ncbi:uncharacterized protein LOC110861056 [Folsomia candida]|uniref:Uncharacterized protein n=1 Tax=Folsomia candida TaxID=158441 RepID=A0A226D3G2_FOLCA|nr:uncharacterized protein LOC110861056 [Folsomia candida]OXA39759.1 hypothetical protein Fcan01_25507 [Folsomia candida]
MQVFAIVLLLVAGSFANSIKQTRETGPPCPLPAEYIGTEGPLNITLHPILEIHQGGTRGVSTINGLDTFAYEYTINLIALTAEFTITVGSLSLDTLYTATGYLDARPFSQGCIPSGNFTGGANGPAPATATVVGLRAVGTATIFINLITDRISLRLLAVSSFSFTTITANLSDDYVIGGSPIDWPAFNAGLKACVDSEFASNNAAVVEKIRLAVNEKIADYTLQDFLDLIGGGGSTCPPPTF